MTQEAISNVKPVFVRCFFCKEELKPKEHSELRNRSLQALKWSMGEKAEFLAFSHVYRTRERERLNK